MKKQRTKIGFLFAIILLASCQGKSIFSDYQTLPSEGWDATESVEIKFTPKDTRLIQIVMYITIFRNSLSIIKITYSH